MKIPDFAGLAKKIITVIPTRNIEKIIFKILLGIWIFTALMMIAIGTVLSARDDIEKRIMETATNIKPPSIKRSEIERYESSLNLVKYPEEIEDYIQKIKRDPFQEYKKELDMRPLGAAKYDFVLKAVDKVQLPLVYRGYIELPDRIVGQINWRDITTFVTVGSSLDGYKIYSISKKEIIAIDEKSRKVEFKLNQPVFSDELQAILHDNISKKTFNVCIASEIGNYKVIEITPDYVVLESEGTKITLEKEP